MTLRRGSSEFRLHCGTLAQQCTHPEFLHLGNGASNPATGPSAVGRRWALNEVIGPGLEGGQPTWLESLMKTHR